VEQFGMAGEKARSVLNAGANWNLFLKIPLIKNSPGLRKVELRISHPPTPGTLLLSYRT